MAHNLNEANGKTSMMYVNEVPWHKLGTKLENPATAAEAIQAAGLDFNVVKKTLTTTAPDLPVVGHYATVRTDNLQVLGVVGSRYEPIQNRDAFTTFDELVGEGEAIYHTAGVLGKGERIWILAKLPDYIRVNGDDLVEKFLLLTNSHDGSGPVRVKLTPIRVVCENTLTVALDGREQEVRKALVELCGPTRREQGCINYDLHQSPDDPALFMFHENWATKGDLDAHSQSAHLQAWRKRAAEMLVEPTKVTLWSGVGETARPN